MDALRTISREHAAGLLSGWARLPALLGLLLIGACSRQGASPPSPGGGEPRIQRILLQPHGSNSLGEAPGLVPLAVGEVLKVQVTAVWGIPSVEDVTPNATLTVEPAAAGILTPGGLFRAQSPGPAHIRAELRVVYGPTRDETLPPDAIAPAGARVLTFTDTLAVTIAAEGPQGGVEQAAGDQRRAFDPVISVVLDSDLQTTGGDEPRMETFLPLVDTRVHGLSDILADPSLRGGQPRLVAGVRPADDTPPIGCPVTGRRLTESDWLLQQENAAAWVTGAPAPAVGVPLVLIATFIENEHGGHLHTTLVCRDVGPLKTPGHTLMPGEFLFLALTDARSVWEDLALAGDSVRMIRLGRAAVVFEALRPGTTGVEVIEHQSWNEDRTRTVSRFEIRVQE